MSLCPKIEYESLPRNLSDWVRLRYIISYYIYHQLRVPPMTWHADVMIQLSPNPAAVKLLVEMMSDCWDKMSCRDEAMISGRILNPVWIDETHHVTAFFNHFSPASSSVITFDHIFDHSRRRSLRWYIIKTCRQLIGAASSCIVPRHCMQINWGYNTVERRSVNHVQLADVLAIYSEWLDTWCPREKKKTFFKACFESRIPWTLRLFLKSAGHLIHLHASQPWATRLTRGSRRTSTENGGVL